ncbi:hypothetical protein M885DRAFT_625448 [Pelagophyceae sp. CCMP2097]|nr:hypothetical protein M885DRAFT_625448 [Pelagophyceae sp. CCMP2097]
MYDDALQASCGKYPLSEEGEGGSDDDVPQSRERKVQKKQEGDELVKLQNEEQGGLNGRKPLDLSQTGGHCLKLNQEFVSRWDAELYCTEVAARGGSIFLKNGAASGFDGGRGAKPKNDFQARIGHRDLAFRCGGCGNFGVHVHRHANGQWFVKKLLTHSDSCKGGNVKAQQALEVFHKQRSNGLVKRSRGTQPHRRYSFEAQHFGSIVATVLHDDLNLKKRGHATA